MYIAARHIRIFSRSEYGATAIEYGLIAGLIFVAIVGSIGALGQGVMSVLYNKIETLF
jgi:Flp pilus assembly pilin Flp